MIKRNKALEVKMKYTNNKSKCHLPETLMENISKYLKGPAVEFLKNQLKLSGVARKGRRYPLSQRYFALSLYFKSPRCYRFLSKIFALPSTRMIRYWLQEMCFSVGWNESVFRMLKKKAISMNPQGKVCGIVFDAVSIKCGLHYNNVKDQIEGFEDLGVYGGSDKPAQFAMVFMAKGLCSKWKQALGYFLFHKSIKAATLRSMILDSIQKLKETSLSPKFLVCDQDPSNRSVLEMLGVTADQSFISHCQERVHVFYDTPHIIKSIRNTLSNYDIKVNSDVVKWKYIEQFYKIDKAMCIKLAPKLTDSHIYFSNFKKMCVKFARQIFSRTVAGAIHTHSVLGACPPEASATAKFIKNIN